MREKSLCGLRNFSTLATSAKSEPTKWEREEKKIHHTIHTISTLTIGSTAQFLTTY